MEIMVSGFPASYSTVDNPHGTVVFAHGSGSSRHSPRNQAVAARLNAEGFDTLLLDLLTEAEEDAERFNVELLVSRLVNACDWVPGPLGLFGASTGAAAALVAAAHRPSRVKAVVSRGGRPDLAGAVLSEVKAPTLLIVGGDDQPVIELNEQAASVLGADLVIIPVATHLFPEPGALEQVADLSAAWFTRFMGSLRVS
jgi:pimeloyl-ACP methyl ester carboxylesterase